MRIQPVYNTSFSGIFRKKNHETKKSSDPLPKSEEPSIQLGEYGFSETPDGKRFFTNYPRRLQESSVTTNTGFNVYTVARKGEDGKILQSVQFIADKAVISDFGHEHRETTYFTSGKKEKTIIQDFKGTTLQKIIYSESDEDEITEIDDYKKGKLSRATTFYPSQKQDAVFVPGHGIIRAENKSKDLKPKQVINFNEEGAVTGKTIYHKNGQKKESTEYQKDGSKTIILYKQDGTIDQAEEYDSEGKILSFSIFNGLGNIVERLEFDKNERPVIKYQNDDMGKPKKIYEYDETKKCFLVTTFNKDGIVETIEAEETDYPNFEEL